MGAPPSIGTRSGSECKIGVSVTSDRKLVWRTLCRLTAAVLHRVDGYVVAGGDEGGGLGSRSGGGGAGRAAEGIGGDGHGLAGAHRCEQ